MQRLRDSSSSDIQIAAESELSRERARFSLETSSPSLRALCGPNPAKISLVCVLVISVWLMAVLVIHLDKKLALTTDTLEDTVDSGASSTFLVVMVVMWDDYIGINQYLELFPDRNAENG